MPTPLASLAVLNVAAYKFTELSDLPALQHALLDALGSRGIKGTVLLAEEGINFFLAAPAPAVHDFLD